MAGDRWWCSTTTSTRWRGVSGSVGSCLVMCALRVIARASSVDLRLREEAKPLSIRCCAHNFAPALASFFSSLVAGGVRKSRICTHTRRCRSDRIFHLGNAATGTRAHQVLFSGWLFNVYICIAVFALPGAVLKQGVRPFSRKAQLYGSLLTVPNGSASGQGLELQFANSPPAPPCLTGCNFDAHSIWRFAP